MVFEKIKSVFSGKGENSGEDYLEIDVGSAEKENKVLVKLFTLKEYDEVQEILNSLREGYTIAMIDIKPLGQKDSIELKRAVAKIKKTVTALEGNIAGFGEHTVIAAPSFAKIYKEAPKVKEDPSKKSRFD